MAVCPRCGSGKVKKVRYRGVDCIVCDGCGFDERDIYEEPAGERRSQKAKGRYSTYKVGGKDRAKRGGR